MKKQNIFFSYLKRKRKIFWILLVFFLLGIISGIGLINLIAGTSKTQVSEYVLSLENHIKSEESINKNVVLMHSMKQNILFVSMICLLGCTFWGSFLVYLAIFYKGFSIGFTISAILATLGVQKGCLFSVNSLLCQNLIFLPMMFILAENSVSLYHNLKNDGMRGEKKEVIRYVILFVISLVIAVISSFFETYISMNFLKFFKNFL